MDHFGEFDFDMVLIIENTNESSVLTPQTMNAIWNMYQESLNVTLDNYKGKTWTYDDVCARQFPSYPTCAAKESGIFSIFGRNPENWATQEDIQDIIDSYKTILDVCCVV